MKYINGDWQAVGIPGFSSGAAYGSLLAIDKTGIPYIAYSDQYDGFKTTVMSYGSPASIKTIFPELISLGPNPAQSTLHIYTPFKVNVILTDITGKELKHINNATTIDISNLAEGII